MYTMRYKVHWLYGKGDWKFPPFLEVIPRPGEYIQALDATGNGWGNPFRVLGVEHSFVDGRQVIWIHLGKPKEMVWFQEEIEAIAKTK